ncbi:MAG TPA: acetylglutamate kinase [Candidatus Eisenbacteria bacterium]|nr:acetylglutamate kinase [Candidatus Eisenbacteria bacterium]
MDVGATAPSCPVVLKLGGRALEREGAWAELATALRAHHEGIVLVHGGGAEVSAWSRRLGLSPAFVDGRRVTDTATLEVAVAVLAGLANKRIVAALRAQGIDAVGLAALDGGLVDTQRHEHSDQLGEVGQITGISPALLDTMLAQGRVPVLASIGAREGQLLNLNADDLASAVAVALRARALVLLSDVPGLTLNGSVVSTLSTEDAAVALLGAAVTGGMRPKLEAARLAIEGGVPSVHLGAWTGASTLVELLRGAGAGTTLVPVKADDV